MLFYLKRMNLFLLMIQSCVPCFSFISLLESMFFAVSTLDSYFSMTTVLCFILFACENYSFPGTTKQIITISTEESETSKTFSVQDLISLELKKITTSVTKEHRCTHKGHISENTEKVQCKRQRESCNILLTVDSCKSIRDPQQVSLSKERITFALYNVIKSSVCKNTLKYL